MQNDLTKGNPMKLIINFTIPIFIGNVFQQFYNMADAIIVGKFVGNGAFAAVGSTGTIMFLIYGFVVGMTTGFTIPVAQKFGAKNYEALRKAVASSYILSLLIGVLLTFLFIVFMHPLLNLMNTPSDIYEDAYTYIIIVSAGILFQMLYNLLGSILRALGDSKMPLVFLIISALLNIFLDLFFIVVMKMGVAGAAIATIMAQGIAGILCLIYIKIKLPILKLCKEDFRNIKNISISQITIGLPMAFQYSITAIGIMMVQTSLNILGSTYVAAFTAGNKIENITSQSYVALGSTMANYSAQNMGYGDIKRIREGFKATTIIGCVYSIFAMLFAIFVGKHLTHMFVSDDVDIIMNGVDTYLKCVSPFFVPLAIVNIYRNGIQGLGFSILPMFAGIAELIGRAIAAVVAGHMKSYIGICLAHPLAWILASILLIVMYYYIMNNKINDMISKNKISNVA